VRSSENPIRRAANAGSAPNRVTDSTAITMWNRMTDESSRTVSSDAGRFDERSCIISAEMG
jgi:hypothetical protein